MAKHRSHSIEFKRQIVQEFIAGETRDCGAKRHDVSRNLIRIWVKKLEAGAFDEDARAAHRRGRTPPSTWWSPKCPRSTMSRSILRYKVTHLLPDYSIGSKSAVEPHERVLKESQLQREAI
jgi:transposase-like protein